MPAWGLDTAPEMFKVAYDKKSDEKYVSDKIHKLVKENKSKSKPRPHKQIVAIALSMAKDRKKK